MPSPRPLKWRRAESQQIVGLLLQFVNLREAEQSMFIRQMNEYVFASEQERRKFRNRWTMRIQELAVSGEQ